MTWMGAAMKWACPHYTVSFLHVAFSLALNPKFSSPGTGRVHVNNLSGYGDEMGMPALDGKVSPDDSLGMRSPDGEFDATSVTVYPDKDC